MQLGEALTYKRFEFHVNDGTSPCNAWIMSYRQAAKLKKEIETTTINTPALIINTEPI